MDSDVVRAVAILGQSLRHRFHSLMLSEMVGFEIIQHPDDFPVGWEGGPGRGSRMVFVFYICFNMFVYILYPNPFCFFSARAGLSGRIQELRDPGEGAQPDFVTTGWGPNSQYP